MPAHALSLASYHRVRRAIDHVVLPQMQQRYACRPLCVREAFIAKYEARPSPGAATGGKQQAGLGMHRDGSLLNCVILLNPRDDFDGGGTAFAPPLDRAHATQVGGCPNPHLILTLTLTLTPTLTLAPTLALALALTLTLTLTLP